ncbi:hypothetical protein D3C81_2206340 [compost metagenome]
MCGQAAGSFCNSLESRLDTLEVLLAEFGQTDTRAIPMEELHLQITFQQTDLTADCRLADM